MSKTLRFKKCLSVAGTLAAWCLGVIFLVAGIGKLGSHDDFTLAIWQFDLISWEASAIAAYMLPWGELAAGVLLFMKRLRGIALPIALALLVIFTGALVTALVRGLDISCGCFGASAPDAGIGAAIVRNMVLIALVLVSWMEYKQHRSKIATSL